MREGGRVHLPENILFLITVPLLFISALAIIALVAPRLRESSSLIVRS